jgi:hypothetical protein
MCVIPTKHHALQDTHMHETRGLLRSIFEPIGGHSFVTFAITVSLLLNKAS